MYTADVDATHGDWRLDLEALSLAALVLLAVTVFFSVALEAVSTGLAWATVIARTALRTRARDVRWPAPAPLVVGLGSFLAVSALSAAFGLEPGRGARMVVREGLSMGAALAAASLARQVSVKTVLMAFLLAAAVAGLWSIYQLAFDFGWQVSFSHRAHGFWHRTAFVSYANVLVLAFAVAAGLVAFGGPRDRLPGLAAATAAAIGMVLSYTRSSWVVAAALVALLAVWRRALLPALGLAVLVAAVVWLPGSDDSRQLVARARSAFDPSAERNLDRVARYDIGLAIIRDHPVLGVGPKGVVAGYDRYSHLADTEGPSHLHNTFLQLLAERGPLGLVTWVAVVVGAMVRGLRCTGAGRADARGLGAGIGLALLAVCALGLFNYHWEDWRMRSLTLLLVGLAWAPGVTGRSAGAVSARAVEGAVR